MPLPLWGIPGRKKRTVRTSAYSSSIYNLSYLKRNDEQVGKHGMMAAKDVSGPRDSGNAATAGAMGSSPSTPWRLAGSRVNNKQLKN